MESSVLNLAHEKQRRAEAFLREGRFEEAAECHETVANLLLEAMLQLRENCGNSSRENLASQIRVPRLLTVESIALQRDYHKRQAQIVRMKQVKYQEYKARVESHKKEMLENKSSKSLEKCYEDHDSPDKAEDTLHQAIYKTIEKQDDLLSLISLPDDEDKAFKHPKDTGTVIEELRTVNSQLRSLVKNLFNELEIKEQEIKRLRLQLASSSENTPCEETRLDGIHSVHLEPLPPLAPLEMPRFDFNAT